MNAPAPSSPATAESFAKAILDEIVAEIEDKRTLPGEQSGLRIAHVIVRRTAEAMGVDYAQ